MLRIWILNFIPSIAIKSYLKKNKDTKECASFINVDIQCDTTSSSIATIIYTDEKKFA